MADNKFAALFDLDGTLMDTADDFVVVLQALSKRHAIAPPEPEKIRNHVSAGARALSAMLLQLPVEDSRCETMRLELLDLYEEVAGQHTVLFPGMQASLSRIQQLGIPWGIVTNKPRRFAEPLIANFGLQPAPGVLVCPDDVANSKPDPESLLLAAEKLNIPPSSCIYVGDHARDIDAGRRAGMTTVAASYGYIESREEALEWQADIVVDNAGELADVVSRFCSQPYTNTSADTPSI